MRNFLIWTLAILLGFEPALMAEGNARQQAEIKAFIEKSQMAQKPVSLWSLANQGASSLPQSTKDELRPFLKNYGARKLPKMDVSRVKDASGQEIYRIQAVQNGQSVVMDLINDDHVFARINGKVLTPQDMNSVHSVMTKLGIPQNEIEQNFGRAPASAAKGLSAEQIQKLDPQDRIQYFKNLRLLMESMEAVEHSFAKHKTSMVEPMNKFEVVARLLRGEEAFAVMPTKCIAAGWEAAPQPDAGGRLKCGALRGQNEVAKEYRKKADGSYCPNDKFACNPLLYPNVNECFAGSDKTTAECNAAVKDSDIPDLSKGDRKKFDEMKQAAVDHAQYLLNLCDGKPASDSGSSEAPARPSQGKAAKARPPKNAQKMTAKQASVDPLAGLAEDQEKTCNNLRERYRTISEMECNNAGFKDKYKDSLCKSSAPVAPTPGPVATAPTTPQTPASGVVSCDQLPLSQASRDGAEVSLCESNNGNLSNTNAKCLGADGKEHGVVECSCPLGKMVGKFKCSKEVASTDSHESRSKRKDKDKGGINWWLVGGIGAVAMLIYYKANKKATELQAKWLEPTSTSTMAPPPTAPPARSAR